MNNILIIIGAVIQFLISTTQLKGLRDKPRNKTAWFIFILFICGGIVTLIKGLEDANSKNVVVAPPIDNLPKFDVKVCIDKIDGDFFYFHYDITNSGLTEAKNVTRATLLDDNLFYTESSGHSPVLINIPAQSTVTEDVPIKMSIKKDSSTIIDVTLSYLDTFYEPHNCVFRFIIIGNSMTTRYYFPVGKKCLDGYPEILPVKLDATIDSTGLFHAQFNTQSASPIIMLKESLGMHSDSLSEEEINSRVNLPWNNATCVISKNRPFKLPAKQMPDILRDSFVNGTAYISGYLIYTPILTNNLRQYTFEIKVHKSNMEYIIEKTKDVSNFSF